MIITKYSWSEVFFVDCDHDHDDFVDEPEEETDIRKPETDNISK